MTSTHVFYVGNHSAWKVIDIKYENARSWFQFSKNVLTCEGYAIQNRKPFCVKNKSLKTVRLLCVKTKFLKTGEARQGTPPLNSYRTVSRSHLHRNKTDRVVLSLPQEWEHDTASYAPVKVKTRRGQSQLTVSCFHSHRSETHTHISLVNRPDQQKRFNLFVSIR